MFKFLKKLAGILDGPQNQMAVDVWATDATMIPQLKQQILQKLHSFVPPEIIKEIFIIGSITG